MASSIFYFRAILITFYVSVFALFPTHANAISDCVDYALRLDTIFPETEPTRYSPQDDRADHLMILAQRLAKRKRENPSLRDVIESTFVEKDYLNPEWVSPEWNKSLTKELDAISSKDFSFVVFTDFPNEVRVMKGTGTGNHATIALGLDTVVAGELIFKRISHPQIPGRKITVLEINNKTGNYLCDTKSLRFVAEALWKSGVFPDVTVFKDHTGKEFGRIE